MTETTATTAKTHKIKLFAADALLWLSLCVLLAQGFSGANIIGRYSAISLRFDTPISGQTAHGARQYSITSNLESPFWPTFWYEHIASFSSTFVTLNAAAILFSGDASLIWPAVYIAGSAPSSIDNVGMAVSEALAWRLWGSNDVIGMSAEVDGEERIVRGVFEGDTELALISFHIEDTSQSWSAVELSGGPEHAMRRDAENFAITAGLGQPDSILMSGSKAFAFALAILPLIIPATYALARIIGFIKKQYPMASAPLFFFSLTVLALLLPGMLEMLPAWLIPTRWSDFPFWASLLQQARDGLREFLHTSPRLIDVELRMLLLKQSGIAFLAICCSISVCFRWHMRQQNT